MKATETTAESLGLQLQMVAVRGPDDFEAAFSAIGKSRAQGLILGHPDAIFHVHAREIARLALKNRLPAVFYLRDFVEAGGLMSYAPSYTDSFRRAAAYVDKILQGAKPADLPIEQPAKFELVINYRTMRALGLIARRPDPRMTA